MKQLFYKELKLCLPVQVPLFFLFAAMLFIPAYPYLVAGYFTCNSIYFMFNQSVGNNDLLFTALLPVSKAQVVKARVRFVVAIQLVMFLLLVPMIFVNHKLVPQGNPAGTDGSLTFLAAALVLFTVFNAVFIPAFYRDETKSGKNFLVSTIAVFVWIILWEGFMITSVAAQAQVPFFRWVAENLDAFPATAGAWRIQLIALAAGALIYGLGTFLVSRKAVRIFEQVDL